MAKTITISELLPPTGLSASAVAGGSLAASTTYYYKLIAIEFLSTTVRSQYAAAHAAPSAEFSATTSPTNKQIQLNWTAPAKLKPANSLGYLVLRTTVAGDYSNATTHMLNAVVGDSYNASTLANVSTYTDDGARVMVGAYIFPYGVPMVDIDTTAGDVINEDDIYLAYVAQGKTAFASRSTTANGTPLQYMFNGYLAMGFLSGCSWTIRPGREVIVCGKLLMDTDVITTMGSSTSGNGATLGITGANADGSHGLRGTFSIYNSKIYEAADASGYTGGAAPGGWNSFRSFNSIASFGSSIIKDSQLRSFAGNMALSGNLAISNTVVEALGRLEASNGYTPALVGITYRGYQLYSYGAPYTLLKQCSMPYASGAHELFFHGASLTQLRMIDLVDFMPTYEPPRGMAASNPAGTWFLRRWSCNVIATDESALALPGVAVSIIDKNGRSSVFTDSGTFASSVITIAGTTLSVADGTKTPVGVNIKLGAEVMGVSAVVANSLTVSRALQATQPNSWYDFDRKIWLQKDAVLTDAGGVIVEQYLTAATYQGLAGGPANYQYTTVTYTPHVITISKYGYQRVTLTQTVAAPIKIAQRMLADAHITATEAVAGAYAGIAIDQPSGTITITEAHTLDELYDYVQWWASRDANLKHAIPLTTADGITYTLDYDLVIDGCTLTGTGNIAMPSNTLTLLSSGSSTVGITHAAGALTTISVTGYTVGARLQVYDTVEAVEIYNGIPAGATLTLVRGWSADHLLRIRMARVVGVDADLPIQTFAVFSQAGAQVLLTPAPDTVYEANGIDGDTVTEFTADFPNVQIDVSDPDGATTPQRGYAWYTAGQMTAPGIANFHGGMSADDSLNYRINASVLDMRVQNVSALPCVIAGARLYRDDGSSIFATGVGPIQAEPSKAYVAAGSSAASVASAVRTELAVELARVDADVSSRLPTAGYVAPDNAGIASIPTTPDARLDNLDVAVSSRLAAVAYTEPPSAPENSDAVWSKLIEAGFSAEQILRIIAASAAGAATGLEGTNPQFKGIDGTTVRIDGAYVAGTRTIDSLNGD